MCKSKIHRATVTQSDLYYEGSLSIDAELMDAADILPYEKIQVVNLNNGDRFETYAIEAKRGSHMVGLNGAAARLGTVGDEIIIMTFAGYSEIEARQHRPVVVLVDKRNAIKELVHGHSMETLE
jgi:aspartate 1-decarboxylase